MKTAITFEPIGIIRTPFRKTAGMPIQPHGAEGIEGVAEIYDDFSAGLADLDGFSHIVLLYHFHQVKGYKLYVVPFMDNKPHGIFATRSPVRPNAIGMSIVKINKIEGRLIYFDGADMLNGTPLLDIKPYYKMYDHPQDVRGGWLEAREDIDIKKIKSDARFDQKKCPELIRCK